MELLLQMDSQEHGEKANVVHANATSKVGESCIFGFKNSEPPNFLDRKQIVTIQQSLNWFWNGISWFLIDLLGKFSLFLFWVDDRMEQLLVDFFLVLCFHLFCDVVKVDFVWDHVYLDHNNNSSDHWKYVKGPWISSHSVHEWSDRWSDHKSNSNGSFSYSNILRLFFRELWSYQRKSSRHSQRISISLHKTKNAAKEIK